MKFRNIRMPSAVTLTAVIMVTAGCSGGSGGGPGASGPLEKTNIVVDAFPAIDSAGLYIAKLDGLFAAQGLNVTIETAQTTQTEVDGQEAGKYDITTGDYVTYIDDDLTQRANLRIIAEASFLQPNVLTLLVAAKPRLDSVTQLRGKLISVNAPNDIGTLLVDSLLVEHGINPLRVRLDSNEPFPSVGKDLTTGKIDAAFAPEPFVSADETTFGSQELADLDQGATSDFPIQGYVVTQAWAQKYPNTLKAFVSALTQGQEIADTNRAAVEQALHSVLGLPVAAGSLISLPSFPLGVDPARLQRVVDAMLQFGILPQSDKNFRITSMIGG
jgi:NitT/TauT family transport system substrate-binding protein